LKLDLLPNGQLKTPGLHDGYILGVLISAEKVIEIIVKSVGGQSFTIRLAGVERFRCDEFLEGNIIDDFHFYSGMAPHREDLEVLLPAPHPEVAQEYKDKYEAYILETSRRIVAGKRVFVRSFTSYGAEIFALCRDVEIEPR